MRTFDFIATAALFLCIGASGAEAVHLRLQETSITENGRVHSEPEVRLRTKGYGVTWIFPVGLGLSYTQLRTEGAADETATAVSFDHSYLDVTATAGDPWLVTFGYGVGVTGDARINDTKSSGYAATAWSLGVGYRLALFEIYWINRLNFPRYTLEGGRTLNITSTHYQLGLGLYLP
jgi:hypothetical protein